MLVFGAPVVTFCARSLTVSSRGDSRQTLGGGKLPAKFTNQEGLKGWLPSNACR